MKLWDPTTGKLLRAFQRHPGYVESVAFSPDGETLASGSSDDTVKLWAVASGKLLHTFKGHSSTVQSVAFSPDGKILASGSQDGTARLWDVATEKLLHTYQDHPGTVYSVAFSPDGKTLAAGSDEGIVKLWDVTTGKERSIQSRQGYIASVTYSPDGKYLAVGTGLVQLWDTNALLLLPAQVATVESAPPQASTSAQPSSVATHAKPKIGHSDRVTSVAFSPDGQRLASGSADKTVKLWDVATGKLLRTLKGHSDFVTSVAFSPDGKHLAAGPGPTKVWDVATGKLLMSLKDQSIARFSPDGRRLASAGNRTVQLWDAPTGRRGSTLKAAPPGTYVSLSLAFSPDSKYLASGGCSKPAPDYPTCDRASLILWHLTTGKPQATLQPPDITTVVSVAYSPDGKYLASAGCFSEPQDSAMCNGGWLQIWSVSTRKLLRAWQASEGSIDSVAFGPDDRTVVSAGCDVEVPSDRTYRLYKMGLVKLWDVATGKLLHTIKFHTRKVDDHGGCDLLPVVLSPDGKHLASGGYDNNIILWDLTTGKQLRTLP